MIFILFDYKCFVIFKNSTREANFVTAMNWLIFTKNGAPPYYSIVAFRPFCFLKFAHAQCKCLEFLAMKKAWLYIVMPANENCQHSQSRYML